MNLYNKNLGFFILFVFTFCFVVYLKIFIFTERKDIDLQHLINRAKNWKKFHPPSLNKTVDLKAIQEKAFQILNNINETVRSFTKIVLK